MSRLDVPSMELEQSFLECGLHCTLKSACGDSWTPLHSHHICLVQHMVTVAFLLFCLLSLLPWLHQLPSSGLILAHLHLSGSSSSFPWVMEESFKIGYFQTCRWGEGKPTRGGQSPKGYSHPWTQWEGTEISWPCHLERAPGQKHCSLGRNLAATGPQSLRGRARGINIPAHFHSAPDSLPVLHYPTGSQRVREPMDEAVWAGECGEGCWRPTGNSAPHHPSCAFGIYI